MRHYLIAAALGCMLLVAPTATYAFGIDDTMAAIDDVSAETGVSATRLTAIVRCETGGTFDPNVIGDHGSSFGPVQLHRGGLLERYYAEGNTSAFNPWLSIGFLARVIRGDYPGVSVYAWSCAR